MCGCCGAPNTVSIGPCSTISPRYMTSTRLQRWRTTDRSWEMNSMATPNSARSRMSKFSSCACIDTSRPDTISSATGNLTPSPSQNRTSNEGAPMRALPTLVEDVLDAFGRPYDGVDHVVMDDVHEAMLDAGESDYPLAAMGVSSRPGRQDWLDGTASYHSK